MPAYSRILLPWDSQPQEAVKTADPWELLWTGASPQYGNRAWSRDVDLVDSVGVAGRSVTFIGNTFKSFSSAGGNTTAQTKVTFCAVVRWVSGVGSLNGIAATASNISGFLLYVTSGGNVRLSKAGVEDITSSFALTSGVTYTIAVSHDQTSGAYYIAARPYSGGTVLVNTGTSTSASVAGNGTYKVGSFRDSDSNRSFNGDISLAAAAFRYVPLADGWLLLDNPWQLFAPRAIWVPVSAGGAPPTFVPAWARNSNTILVGGRL